jgi:uncharacterized protein YraI
MLLLAALLIPIVTSAAQVGVVVSVQTELTLRVGPGTEWRIISRMPVGTNVALDGRDESGLWVRGITQNSEIGWMAARYLTIGADGVFALPVIDREAPISVGTPPPGSVPVASAPADAPASEAPAQAVVAPITGGLALTANANVNMRSGPDTSYRRVGGMNAGESLNVDGRDGTLSWVRGINSQGVVGWAAVNFLSVSYDQLAALPVVDVNSPFGLAAPAGSQPQVASAPIAAPIVGNTAVTGFSYGGHVTGLDDQAVNYMRIAGMSWAKFQVRYNQGDNPAGVAGLIADTHAKGFRILLGVVGFPNQINNGGYFESYASFVAGLTGLGADAIEIWNEPNLDREWPAGQINPAQYTQLLAQAFNAIKGVNRNTLVISGAPAPTGAEAAFPGRVMNDNNYIAGMVAAGALNYMDCLGAHYNEGIVPPNWTSGDPRGDNYYTRYYAGMVDTYNSIIGGRRPICFTELGYLTPEGFPPLPGFFDWARNVTVAQQAQWLDQVMSMARSSGRVRIVIIWNINFREYGADPMGGFAIIRPDGSCPACSALGN